jgi:ribosomal protein S18 acetylase RimI-like enzyme
MARIRPSSADHNTAFMDEYWPAYDRPLGIEWVEVRGHLRAEGDGGETLGIANYSVVGGLGHLQQILVRHDHAKSGTGSQLLRAFEADCEERGCHKLRLETADYQARGFYEKYGWRVAATLEHDRFDRTCYIMEKPLP